MAPGTVHLLLICMHRQKVATFVQKGCNFLQKVATFAGTRSAVSVQQIVENGRAAEKVALFRKDAIIEKDATF